MTQICKNLLFVYLCFMLGLSSVFPVKAQTVVPEEQFEIQESDAEDDTWLPESLQMTGVVLVKNRQLRKDYDLNPDGALFELKEKENRAAIDLDWNPQVTDSIMFRSRGLLTHGQLDDTQESDISLLEGYLQWKNISHTLVTDVGKIKVEWGSGYAWNPTQVLVMPTDDSNTLIDDHDGVGMIRIAWSKDRITFIAIAADLERDSIKEETPLQSVVKMSLNLEPWEVELLHYQATEIAVVNGFSFSGLLSDSLEIHGEWSRTGERDRHRIGKAADGIQMGAAYLPARYEYLPDKSDDDFDRILLGGQYTFSNDINIIIELYRTTHGYSNSEWESAEQGIAESLTGGAWKNPNAPFASAMGNPYAGFLMNTAAAVRDEQLRQNYLFFRFSSGESDNNWEWEQVLFLNLDDSSQLHQVTINKSWFDTVNSSLEITLFRGDSRSEYGLNPYSETLAFLLEYHF